MSEYGGKKAVKRGSTSGFCFASVVAIFAVESLFGGVFTCSGGDEGV